MDNVNFVYSGESDDEASGKPKFYNALPVIKWVSSKHHFTYSLLILHHQQSSVPQQYITTLPIRQNWTTTEIYERMKMVFGNEMVLHLPLLVSTTVVTPKKWFVERLWSLTPIVLSYQELIILTHVPQISTGLSLSCMGSLKIFFIISVMMFINVL